MSARRPTALVTLLITCTTTAASADLGTAFTYQGRLEENGAPYPGSSAAVRFELWADPNAGALLAHYPTPPGTTVTVAVADGLLTVPVDFGASAFSGEARWVQVHVNGTALWPRQPVTVTPYAAFARAPWTTSGGNLSYAAGQVSIGTTAPNPGTLLTVAGEVKMDGLRLSSSAVPGYVLTCGAAGLGTWQPPASFSLPYSGTVSTSGLGFSVTNQEAGSGSGILAEAANFGGLFYAGGASGTGVVGIGTAMGSVTNFGGQFVAHGESGIGVFGNADATGPVFNYGGLFFVSGDSGTGVYASASAQGPVVNFGGDFSAWGDSGTGVRAIAHSSTGTNYGIRAKTYSDDGYAGYFEGRSFFGGNVGIGTSPGSSPLVVGGLIESTSGGLKFPDGSTQSSAGWSLEGNAGTDPNTDFIGTADARTLKLGANGVRVMTIDPNGNVVIGATAAATTPFAVIGVRDSIPMVSGLNYGFGTAVRGVAGQHIPYNYSAAYGGEFTSLSKGGIAVYGRASAFGLPPFGFGLDAINYGGYFLSEGNLGTGVRGESYPPGATDPNDVNYGGYFVARVTTRGIGAYGEATGSNGTGVFGYAGSGSGTTCGVRGHASSANGYAGYFTGRGYFSGNVGIGAESPTEKLDVNGTARLRGIGSGTGTTIVADANGKLWKNTSSRRYKTNIAPLPAADAAVLGLRPVSFDWKATGERDIGLIAEEVAAVLPDLVLCDTDGQPEAVKYDRVAIYLIDVVRRHEQQISEQQALIEALETQVERQRVEYAALREDLAALRRLVDRPAAE